MYVRTASMLYKARILTCYMFEISKIEIVKPERLMN